MNAPIRGKYSKVAAIDQPANHFRMNDKSYIFNHKCIRNIRDIYYEQQLISTIGSCSIIKGNNTDSNYKSKNNCTVRKEEPRR